MIDQNWALARKQFKLAQRARIIQAVRAFFISRGYLEIETPCRIPCNAPETHIDPIESAGWWLQTSPELAMKRLLAAGFPNMFQICRVWRYGEQGQWHLPEFTMLEWYQIKTDYQALMDDCEELLQSLVPDKQLTWQGNRIDLTTPWERLSVAEAFERYATLNLEETLSRGCFEEVLTEEVEPHLGRLQPTFLTDYPVQLGALARTKTDQPDVVERFELYCFGIELANAFSELNDVVEQRSRFEKEESMRHRAGKPSIPTPDKFLNELANMPQSAGIALGLDRLIMFLTGANEIGEVVAFVPDDL